MCGDCIGCCVYVTVISGNTEVECGRSSVEVGNSGQQEREHSVQVVLSFATMKNISNYNTLLGGG